MSTILLCLGFLKHGIQRTHTGQQADCSCTPRFQSKHMWQAHLKLIQRKKTRFLGWCEGMRSPALVVLRGPEPMFLSLQIVIDEAFLQLSCSTTVKIGQTSVRVIRARSCGSQSTRSHGREAKRQLTFSYVARKSFGHCCKVIPYVPGSLQQHNEHQSTISETWGGAESLQVTKPPRFLHTSHSGIGMAEAMGAEC